MLLDYNIENVKEHQDACKRGDEKVSAIVELVW